MRIGIGVDTSAPLDATLENFRQAEADGFASAWIANIFSWDAVTLLALAGRVTERMELGSFVVPTYPRHPAALAQSALTASAAADGRFTLGIGLSHKVAIEDMFGLDYSKPARHMREYLSVLMLLVHGEAVRYRGEEYRVAAQLTVPGAKPPQVIVAALGPAMLKIAGRMADGTATWMGGPKYLAETAIPTIREAAREAGRPEPRIVSGFPIAVTNEVDSARSPPRTSSRCIGSLPSYRAVLDVEGAATPADVAIVGNESEVEQQLRHLADIGVTDFNASPFGVRADPGAASRTREFLKQLAGTGI